MAVTRVFLVRHGETDWKKENRFRGVTDVPLNDAGRAQIKAVGRFFAGRDLSTVYASPLSRTLDTAKALAGRRNAEKVRLDDGLKDINRAEWEGLTYDQARDKFPKLYKQWLTAPHEVRFPGGESLVDVRRRTWTAFQRVVQKDPGPDVAVVSHHIVFRVILCSLLGMELSRFRQFELAPPPSASWSWNTAGSSSTG